MSSKPMKRMEKRMALLQAQGRAGLVTYVMASDPDYTASLALLKGLAASGADILEIGMPFSDPMADGPTIQAAAQRSLAAGGSVKNTLKLVQELRGVDADVPVVLMGYYNPVYHYGVEAFCRDAREAGVDGLILVDLPPEEEGELVPHLGGLDFIRLIAPTTDEARLPGVVRQASGFLYYISVKGITGGKAAETASLREPLARIRAASDLPVAVGFGISTPEQAAGVAQHADLVVVGSELIKRYQASGPGSSLSATLDFTESLAGAIHNARRQAA